MTRIAEGRLSPDERTRLGGKLIRLQDWFLEGSRREARAGARLIAWPEGNLLINPTGTIVVSYLKSHAVPGWEAGIMRRGDGRRATILKRF